MYNEQLLQLYHDVHNSSTICFLGIYGLPSRTEIGNGTDIPYYDLGASLALCGTIVSRLDRSPIIPLTKALLLVRIEALIVFRKFY